MSFRKFLMGAVLLGVSTISFAQATAEKKDIFDGKNEDGLVNEVVIKPGMSGSSDSEMGNFLRKYLPYPSDVAGAKLAGLKISSVKFNVSVLDSEAKHHPMPENAVLADWVKGAYLAMGYEITGAPSDPEVELTGFCEEQHCIANLWLKRSVEFEVEKGDRVKLPSTPVMHWDSFRSYDPASEKRAAVVLDMTKDMIKSFSLDVIKAVSN